MLEYDFYPYIVIALVAISTLSIIFNFLQRKTIAELKESARILIKDAYLNPITALPNDNNFSIVIKKQIDRAQRHEKTFLLIYIKLRYFKSDEDIINVGTKLAKSIRSEDYLAHIGEDEFVILYNEYLAAQNYEIVIKRIVKAFPKYTIRIGTSVYPLDAVDKKYLVKKAIEDSQKSLY